jgi:FixJ family two-component response regulator
LIVYVVDDDDSTGNVFRLLLKTVGVQVQAYTSPIVFLEEYEPDRPGCIILDLWMPELNGIETLAHLRRRPRMMPVILVSGDGYVSSVIRAMKLGAVDFFEKPVNSGLLLESVQNWIQYDMEAHVRWQRYHVMSTRLATLSARERQVLECVLNSMPNKEIARYIGVSPKAIETYRANLMRKMQVRTAVGLVLLVAGCVESAGQPLRCPTCLYRT